MSTESGGDVTPLKRALLAIQQLKARVQSIEHGPIAIVGAGLRFPGGVRDTASYWDLLGSGRDAVREVPPDRWDADAWTDRDPDAPGKMTVREAGFLDDIATFDAGFFGISPREALEMDPAQRLLLEVAWEALEDASIAPDSLARSPTGVYVGLGLSDYGRKHFLGPDPSRMTAYSGTGTFLSVAAGRISYTLGLQGPAMTVDTACSSSLVSVHLAVEALRRGEIDTALAGGANVICAPEPSVYFSKLGATSPDGRCKTFDARADGYGRGEGAGVVVLKRLADAVADGDRILAVIRGTAVNQDGRSNGLTAPNGSAQTDVVRAALRNAEIHPDLVGYVEAHGTGTPLGDPIEIEALKAVFGGRTSGEPVRVGSVKTNFGHLETAAGIAGLLKVALCVRNGAIPPHLHLRELNPRIVLEGSPLEIPTETTPWSQARRIAGVSSFALSGTNAHIVVEGPPVEASVPAVARPIELVTLSARTPEALAALAGRWAAPVRESALADVARNAAIGRASLPVRLAVTAASPAEAAERLAAVARGEDVPGVVQGEARGTLAPALGWLFTGQGAQHVGMGERLYAAEPAFRDAFDAVCAVLDPLLGRETPGGSIRDVTWGSAPGLDDTENTQPALFALEVALARFWQSVGVEPDVLVGHSIGEIAAAHVAGVLSLADAAKLVVERGRLMGALPRDGAMLAVFASEAEVRAALAPYTGAVDVSGINNPTETVVSGRTGDIEALARTFEASGVRVRRLAVSHAFHSSLMDPILDRFEAVARTLTFHPPRIPIRSNLDGKDAGARLQDPAYWRRHVREAVRFADGLMGALGDGQTLFLEIGPRPVLSAMGARCAEGVDATFLASLHPDRDDLAQITETMGALWTRGVDVDLRSRYPSGPRLALPTMPWVGERYWLETPSPVAADPLAPETLELAWRPAPVPRGAPTGTWIVIGDDALATVLAARGATVLREWAPGAAHLVYAPADGAPADLAWEAIALSQKAVAGETRIHLVSHAERSPATAVLRGIGRTLAAEHPERWGGWIDVALGTDDELVDALVADDGEDLVQLRSGRRAARLRRSDRARTGPALAVDGGAVLVTGGFGALGRQIARRLVDLGARHLVLLGRSGSRGAEAFVAELAGGGTKVEAHAVDLADRGALAALIAGLPDLVGVVHAAGASRDARLVDQDRASVDAVFGPKVSGAEHLAALTADRSLQFFVVLSSAAGLVGVPGQANYAAANAWLDAFARSRRALGLPAVSLVSGPWAGEGMAGHAGEAVRAAWAREGVVLLDPADALRTFERTAAGDRPEIVVAPFDWSTWRKTRPFASHLADELVPADAVAPETAGTALVAQLRAAPAGARRAMVTDHVQQLASRVLGFDAGRRLPTRDGFFDAGMDSLMAVDLRERLQRSVGVPLSATLAFDHPTVEAVTEHLLAVVLGEDTARAPAAAAASTHEPIAIVGASCRMPGGVTDLDSLWALLEGGVDAITDVPRDRWDVDRYYDPTPGTPGKSYSRQGGFVDGIEQFDPAFFGISPREARSLDPQQRLLLECSWHALEDAAIPADQLGETRTGVYVGVGQSEYWHRFDPTVDDVDAYAGTGNETSFAAGRVSYVLGLQGPSMSVNTACSSSLVSVHMAVRALREGQCDLAVAGGVNAIVGPETTIWMSMLRALAPDDRCKAFDARADGYVRSEGCGMVVLKRLSEAVRDNDRIYAVIRGTAVNHDGASSGLTVPNGLAQQQVIREALADGGVDADSIGFVECHGTGTRLGDPIEVRALGTVFATDRPASRPLFLGAIKANIGHLEAAAGIAGLLRAMLAIHRRTIPPIVHLETPNPSLPLAEFPAVTLPVRPVAWEGHRMAGVSSFGISGTNAHLVLEEPPARADVDRATERPVQLLTLSGRSEAQVRAQAGALLEAEVPLADLAYTLNAGRSHLPFRSAVVASDLAGARAGLAKLARSTEPLRAAVEPPRIVFLCTGAGPQALGMARALYDADPVFRDAFDAACRAADPLLGRSLFDVVYGADEAPLHDLAYTQPAMFAIEWAMAATWAAWGIRPSAVIGHSTGQYVAACLAGVFDLETGMRLLVQRAKLMSDEPKIGEMVACFATEEIVRAHLRGHEAEVSIAAVNGPEEVVISGLATAVNPIASRIEAAGIEIRRLRISHAAHSPLMDPILDRFEALVASVSLSAPTLPLVENVSGGIAGAEVETAAYWREHMRRPVQFHRGMRTLIDGGYRVFLEIGNHPVLAGAGARSAEDAPDTQSSSPGSQPVAFLPSLRRDRPDWEQLLETVGRLSALGADVDWRAFHIGAPGARVALPGTVFQRKRHWVDRVDRNATKVVGAEWTYGIRWAPIRPNVEAFGSRGDKPMIVFADAGGIGDALAARQQRRVVRVRPGAAYVLDGDVATLDPSDPAQLDRLLGEVGPAHVVHLWALDAAGDTPTEAALLAVLSALNLLVAAARTGRPTVWLVTRGAVSVAGEAPNLAQAPMNGLGNTAAMELSDLPVVRVDLDPAAADPTMHLELVLNSGLVEDQVAVRDGNHFARRLVRIPAQGAEAPPIRSDGTYLVTGGLGAIGLRVARWLADRGAGAIVVTGRTERSAALPANTVFVPGDVADAGDVARILAGIRERGLPELKGVFHAAGVLDDDWLGNLDRERIVPVWRPKLEGAWNLHRAVGDVELFVLFSSAASLLGNPGQASYACANAFLDGLAELRRAEGRHAVSLCWGPWADGGLATEAGRQWDRGGIRPLAPSLAIAVLGQRLGGPEAVSGIVDLDWKRWPAALPRVPSLVSGLVERDEVAPVRRSLLGDLREAAPAKRRELLAVAVSAEAGAILGLEGAEVDPTTGFFDSGMDSLMAVELANRLKARLERPLPATLAFDHPTVNGLVDWLLRTLALGDAPAPSAVARAERRVDLDAPIAVVGMSCRMPGGANDPESFWELLRSGRDPMREVPPERWDLSDWYDPAPGTPGKMYVRDAGWVDHALVEGFDPEFFGISPREAESMDPQQRMLLEVSYEALERAGLTTTKLAHSRTGVFVGAGSSGYHQRFQKPGGPLYVDQYAGTGELEAFVSGRVAYVLGLHGPNLALNTACSSALTAFHLACQSLRMGDSDAMLAGGVHLMLSPENFVYVSQLRAVSADGRCKTFDARADGYGRSEGCGMLVLKRLADAERDGDPVLAVIRGTACGHDGPSSGLTVPYGPAQVQVLSDAVARSGIDPHDVSYLEAHGTGTVLGDPIEVHAAEEVYCRGRAADNPLHIGAVKSNVGHLEVAAGAASLVKMVLALQHREIPPHLHFRAANPDLDLGTNGMVVDTAPTPWTSPRGPLRAGISGFGLAGTNVHLVMEEAPQSHPKTIPDRVERPAHLLALSARSPEALRELASRYARHLRDSGSSLADVAFSAATTRIPYEHRLALTASDASEAADRLSAFVVDGEAPLAVTHLASGRAPKVVFLFSGQGSQYAGMGRELYENWPVFREVVDRCAAILDPLLAPVSIADVLFGSGDIDDTTYTQPALFVLEVALAELWRSWGVVPAVVLGHSIGQIAAATVAGVFSLEDGLRLVAERGRLMGALPREGAMLAVFADEAVVRRAIAPHGDSLGIAALNNPGETTISGRTEAVAAVAASLSAEGIDSRSLTVSHAFHSPLMDPMLAAFEAVARTVVYRPATIPVVCNLTGRIATDAELGDPAYWRDLVRSAVRFADGLQTLGDEGYELFVEIGPHTALLGMGRRTLTGRSLAWLPSLQRGEPVHDRILPSLGALWTRGVPVALEALDRDTPRARVPLPTYPWQRRRIWMELEEFPGHRAAAADWLVVPEWEPRAPTVGAVGGNWKIVGTGPDADRVRRAMTDRGARLVDDHADLAGVVVVPSVPEGIGADPATPALSLLQLAQTTTAPLTIVTRGATSDVTRPLAGTLWGLGRVIRAEKPELRTVLIDLPEGEVDDTLLVDAIAAVDREPEVALRGVRTVMRLARTSFAAPTPALDDGVILVTGGLAGLGLEAARWLADHGARHLVLVARSTPSAETGVVLAELRERGVDVVVARGDVADAADVERIVGEIAGRGVPLVGIIHSAGVLADAALARLDAEAFRKVYAPKVQGTWNLHQATRDRPLRFFVLFAAGAGLMGSPGQGNYAAANAFQDAFAHWRRAQGLPAVSIDWGAWGEVGMAARAGGLASRQAEEGIRPIPLRAGMDAMGRLLGHPAAQIGVLNVDWDRLVATVHRGTRPAAFERLAGTGARPVEVSGPSTKSATELPALLALIEGRPRAEWDAIVEDFVEGAAVRILRRKKGDRLDRENPLLEYGLDSLLAIELKNAIMDAGVDLAVARVMTGPSIRQLGQMVLTTLDQRAPAPMGPVAAVAPSPVESEGVGSPASHVFAFVMGVILVVMVQVLYVGSARVWGVTSPQLPSDAEAAVEQPVPVAPRAAPAPQPEPPPKPHPAPGTKAGKVGKKRPAPVGG